MSLRHKSGSLMFHSGQVAILVRKRVGNPVDYFDKTFAEYEEGFESKGKFSTPKETLSIYSAPRFFFPGESWLGLKKLHQLTSESSGSLQITLKDFDNNTYVAFYDQFQVRDIFSFSNGVSA